MCLFWASLQNANKLVMFQDALKYNEIILLCYGFQMWTYITSWVPPPLSWNIVQIVMDNLNPIV